MKRIAIITSGHTGSTLPLAKHLALLGYSVDLFFETSIIGVEQEGFDCVRKFFFHQIKILDKKYWKGLLNYMGDIDFRLCYYRIIGIPHSNFLSKHFAEWQVKRVCQFINKQAYDYINLVGRYNISYFSAFSKFLKGTVIVSLHEVCNHRSPDFSKEPEAISGINKRNWPIVVHSTNSYKSILKYASIIKENVYIIPFGIFESYLSIEQKNSFEDLGHDYVLFIGSLQSHKGIGVLLNAIKSHKESFKDIKFVIAGRGYVPEMADTEKDKSIVFINKFLSNTELVDLIRNCRFIVCPYQSMSQSGIPLTSYVFGKPVIASNLLGFKGIVDDREEGLLFETGNSDDLASKMEILLHDDLLYSKIQHNVLAFKQRKKLYSWENIAKQYVELFRDVSIRR